MSDKTFLPRFLKDVDQHIMQVVRDDGVNRHIRFRRPGTMTMHFDLITWPGYLCYTGDMGTYVFRRLQDMFEFFRRSDADRRYDIDMRYWAEKVEAQDKGDGIEEFSTDAFAAAVKEVYDQYIEGNDDLDAESKTDLWDLLESDVISRAEDESTAMMAIHEFREGDFVFSDWEYRCKEFSHRFQWCCHALAWAIDMYDAQESGHGVPA